MAALQKYWREAATVIVIARTKVPRATTTTHSIPPVKPCRSIKTDVDYRVLMLKRSGKSKFMPSAYVFPGGVASNADFAEEWGDLFKQAGIDLSNWNRWPSNKDNFVSPMLTRDRDPEFSTIPSGLAFRISAIRETFEESGLLLVRNASSMKLNDAVDRFSKRQPITSSLCANLEESVLVEWRTRVDKDAGEFLRLCKENNFVPDVWSLYDWSNWLTPASDTTSVLEFEKHPRRFDTAFYICVLDDIPAFIEHDSQETVSTEWFSPAEVLSQYREMSVMVPPPQTYELARLIQFSTAEEISWFAIKRAPYEMERWLPVRVVCSDGIFGVYPGDELYPDDPDLSGTVKPIAMDISLREARKHSKQNRLEIFGRFDLRIRCNIDQSPKHISPLSEEDLAVLHPTPTANL